MIFAKILSSVFLFSPPFQVWPLECNIRTQIYNAEYRLLKAKLNFLIFQSPVQDSDFHMVHKYCISTQFLLGGCIFSCTQQLSNRQNTLELAGVTRPLKTLLDLSNSAVCLFFVIRHILSFRNIKFSACLLFKAICCPLDKFQQLIECRANLQYLIPVLRSSLLLQLKHYFVM